ncbi:XkdW family protein [Clostridium sp.]|uniref:XkdW family protein n=1 Tax=Clostridium sp. TaxID=1506 RepID=UPI003216EFDB
MVYINLGEDKKINGFYVEDVHGLEKCETIIANGGLKIDEELWQYILTLGECKFTGTVEAREYTIVDKDLFEIVVQPVDTTPQPPTFNEQLAALGEELTQEKLRNIQKDATISQLGEELASVKLEVINMKGGN